MNSLEYFDEEYNNIQNVINNTTNLIVQSKNSLSDLNKHRQQIIADIKSNNINIEKAKSFLDSIEIISQNISQLIDIYESSITDLKKSSFK